MSRKSTLAIVAALVGGLMLIGCGNSAEESNDVDLNSAKANTTGNTLPSGAPLPPDVAPPPSN